MIREFWQKIREWWQGEYIPPPENDPSDPIVIISTGYYEHPLPRKIYEWTKLHLAQEWKYWLPTTVGLIGLIVTVIQVYDHFNNKPDIETFTEHINLTYDNSDTGIIEFLENNEGKTVFIDSFIDTSLSVEDQWLINEKCDLDIDAIIEKEPIIGIPLPLPVYESAQNYICADKYLVLDIGDDTVYEPSYGGTGVVMIRFKGFFDVSQTYHAGLSKHYHLKEIQVPFEVREQLLR